AEAEAIDPNDLSVMGGKAIQLYRLRRFNEAIASYQHLLNEYPNTDWAYLMIGQCYNDSGRPAEAVPMVRMAVRLDPRSPRNDIKYGVLAWALLMLGQNQESIVWNERALATAPSNYTTFRAQFNLRIAAAYARLGDMDEARRALAETNRVW